MSDILIVGHGICGAWLAYFLEKAGISYEVIDNDSKKSASRIASGIINPVTGRRLVKTWLIDTLLPFCREVYTVASKETGTELVRELPLIDFHSNFQRQQAFSQRIGEGESYLSALSDNFDTDTYFTNSMGYGTVKGCMLVHMRLFIEARKKKLLSGNQLRLESYEAAALKVVGNHIEYRGKSYRKIIFCDGADGFTHTWFSSLPFAACKGEVLWMNIPGLPPDKIYKKGITIVPWDKEIFWVGSSYEWSFNEPGPTRAFHDRCVQQMKEWLKIPFEVVDHQAAIRPATFERRPFVGFHPRKTQIGILNGMGTKGCSLAPFFAKALTENLKDQRPIHPEADILRFNHILAAFDA